MGNYMFQNNIIFDYLSIIILIFRYLILMFLRVLIISIGLISIKKISAILKLMIM
jgi:hypothetical protein